MKINLPNSYKIVYDACWALTQDNIIVSTQHLWELYGNYFRGSISGFVFVDEYTDFDINISSSLISEYPNIVGFGGGKVLDIAKYIAWNNQLNYIAIPTCLSNDGITSHIAILPDRTRVACNVPKEVIFPMPILEQAPIETTYSGIGDVLSNLSALQDWQLAALYYKSKLDPVSFALSKFAAEETLKLIKKDSWPHKTILLTALAHKLYLSGCAMAIYGDSTPCSGSEHLICHAIDKLWPNNKLHGYKVAFGTAFCEKLRNSGSKVLYNGLKQAKLPLNLNDLGINEDVAIKAILAACSSNRERFTVLQFTQPTENQVYQILMEMNNDQ